MPKVNDEYPNQLILRFDDISSYVKNLIEPEEKHILQALSFAEKINDGYIQKGKKMDQFDNDYEKMMKERGEIIPNRPR